MLGTIGIEPDRSSIELRSLDFGIDQQDVIYDGAGRLVNCAARTLELTSQK